MWLSRCPIYVFQQEVRRAIYNEEIEVAVKTLKENAMSEDSFIDEAKIMVLVVMCVTRLH